MSALPVQMPRKVYKTRKQWLRARHKGIGASDAPIILGVSPWESPYSLWLSKINPVIDFDGTMRMRIGSMQERSIAEMYAEFHGAKLSNPGKYTIYQHPEYPWMLATPDRFQDDGAGAVEIKNVDRFKAKDWADGACPLMYEIQVQHQLAVTGLDYGVIVALIGGNDLQVRRIERNDRLINAMIPKLERFWNCVQTKTAPEIDGHEATHAALDAVRETPGVIAELPAELAEEIETLEGLQSSVNHSEAEIDAIKARIKAMLGDAEAGYLPDGRGFTWREQTSRQRLEIDPVFTDALIEGQIPFETKGGTRTRVLRKSTKREKV